MTRKFFPALQLFLTVLVIPVFSYEPSYSLTGYSRGDVYSDADEVYGLYGLAADAGQRIIFDSGYCSWGLAGLYERYWSGIEKSVDAEQLSLDLHVNRGRWSFEAGTALNLSVNTVAYGTLFQPDWKGSIHFNPAASSFFGSIDYTGSSLYQESGDGDRLAHSLSLTAGYDWSLRFGMYLTLGAGMAGYSEDFLLDESNTETGNAREDGTLFGEVGFEGLLGYFADWKGSIYTEYLDSDANRWIDGSALLEENSEDSWTVGGAYELNWSPVRSARYSVAGYTDYRRYVHRTVVDSNEISTGRELSYIRTGLKLDADWTTDDVFFWKVSLDLFRSFSDDPDFDTWELGVQAGIQYVF